jgi:hypothetical protein
MATGNGSGESYFELSTKVREVDRRVAKLEADKVRTDQVLADIRTSMQKTMAMVTLLVEGFQSLTDPERLSRVLDAMSKVTKTKPS